MCCVRMRWGQVRLLWFVQGFSRLTTSPTPLCDSAPLQTPSLKQPPPSFLVVLVGGSALIEYVERLYLQAGGPTASGLRMGSPGVVAAVTEMAVLFVSLLDSFLHDRKWRPVVLVVEALGQAKMNRKRKVVDDAAGGEPSAYRRQLIDTQGLDVVLELLVLELIMAYGLHVKKTARAGETDLFLRVLKWKSGLVDGGSGRGGTNVGLNTW